VGNENLKKKVKRSHFGLWGARHQGGRVRSVRIPGEKPESGQGAGGGKIVQHSPKSVELIGVKGTLPWQMRREKWGYLKP